jgi:hypothetical protein
VRLAAIIRRLNDVLRVEVDHSGILSRHDPGPVDLGCYP